MKGYAHAAYAASLSDYGSPRLLRRCKGWILERSIPDTPYRDAMGCYPLFVCQDWSQLKVDLEQIGDSLVCLSLVTDPFGEYDLPYLRQCFPEVTIPFKQHFVVDLRRQLDTFVHPHHRRNASRARHLLAVEKCVSPHAFLDDWTALYEILKKRHDITGVAAFSKESFAKQLAVPGIEAFRAMDNEETVGMLLWYTQANRAYYHLGAYSARGYDLGASFALFSYGIEYFAQQGCRWLDLGAGAGTSIKEESGLGRFKKGWSTGVRSAYLCGRIFERKKYEEIVRAKNVRPTGYFPGYRVGEFE